MEIFRYDWDNIVRNGLKIKGTGTVLIQGKKKQKLFSLNQKEPM